jgi:hypothetical protein
MPEVSPCDDGSARSLAAGLCCGEVLRNQQHLPAVWSEALQAIYIVAPTTEVPCA